MNLLGATFIYKLYLNGKIQLTEGTLQRIELILGGLRYELQKSLKEQREE